MALISADNLFLLLRIRGTGNPLSIPKNSCRRVALRHFVWVSFGKSIRGGCCFHIPARDSSLPLMRVGATPPGSRPGKEFLPSVAWRYNPFTFFKSDNRLDFCHCEKFSHPAVPRRGPEAGEPSKICASLVFPYHASSGHHADSIWL